MRRLTEHQIVTVELDQQVCIDCQVGNASAPVATLAPIDEIPSTVQELLTPGCLAFMTFEHHGLPVALRGAARAIYGGTAVEFVVIDGVQLQERRRFPRLPIRAPVTVRPAVATGPGADQSAIQTITDNLSLRGAQLARHPGLGNGPWKIELQLPNDLIPVHCGASLVRRTKSHLGIRFIEISDADLIRLAGALADREQLSWP
jgi:hypothetical protein